MLNLQEIETVRKWGGRMRKENHEAPFSNHESGNPLRLHIESPDVANGFSPESGILKGIYENYLLLVSNLPRSCKPLLALDLLNIIPTLM
jgi:hypothetical protein